MSYPTVSGPYGLVPVKLLSGSPFIGVMRHFKVASGYATPIYHGDVVKLVTGGTVERDAFDAAMTPVGVFLGCTYTDPNLGYKLWRQSYPGGIVAPDIEAMVVDSTDLLFKVAVLSSGTTIGALAQTDIGANVAGVDNTGDSMVGSSRGGISNTTATTNTLPFRIIGLVEETKNSSGGYTEAYVKWNAGHQYNDTTGV